MVRSEAEKQAQKRWQEKNREKLRDYQREYHHKNRDKHNKRAREWAKSSKGKQFIKKYQLEHRDEINKKVRERNRKIKLKVLSHYGLRCVCCGENHIEFLTIEHMDGGGKKQRKECGNANDAIRFYRWIIKNNFPPGLTILCFNCNIAKGIYGKCPHLS